MHEQQSCCCLGHHDLILISAARALSGLLYFQLRLSVTDTRIVYPTHSVLRSRGCLPVDRP